MIVSECLSAIAEPLMNLLQVDNQEKDTKGTKLSENETKVPKMSEKETKATKLSAPTHTLSPPRKWLSEPDTDEKVNFIILPCQLSCAQIMCTCIFEVLCVSFGGSPFSSSKVHRCDKFGNKCSVFSSLYESKFSVNALSA